MDALLLAGFAGLSLLAAYLTYGRWVARRVFQLREDASTPAFLFEDGHDYCPTPRSVVFGHHFTSIAGTGPIVGPAIAVMWGWLPAVAWVLVGAIFIGAAHDLGSLVVSMRNKGRTIGDIAGDLLGPRVRLIFLGVLTMGLWIVLAIFGLVIAAVLRQYPSAIFPVHAQIPIAVAIGVLVHRRGGKLLWPSLIALGLMYASVVWGDVGLLHRFNEWAAAQPLWAWVVWLLVYAYVASVLPVWALLQPRDYINALQLVSALGLLVAGLIVAAVAGGAPEGGERRALEIVAPMVNLHPTGAPPLAPMLFITIACGAVSGFHCLVSSGTTSKQIRRETDALPVGVGSMLTESFLAVLVIIACVAGIGLGMTKPFRTTGMGYPSPDAPGVASGHAKFPSTRGDYLHLAPMIEARDLSSNGIPLDADAAQSDVVLHRGHDNAYDGFGVDAAGSFVEFKSEDGAVVDVRSRRGPSPSVIDFDGEPIRLSLSDWSYTVAGPLAFRTQYQSWSAAGGLGATVGAFVIGAANLVESLGIPHGVAVALMGVLVASFAGTTMDTACRLQRYVIQELARTFLPRAAGRACGRCGYDLSGLKLKGGLAPCPECGHANGDGTAPAHAGLDAQRSLASNLNPFKWLATTHGATLFAVVSAAALAAIPAPGQPLSLAGAGQGGLILWPLFGATNQLLGGLAFCVIGAWLVATRRPWWFIVVPGAFMLAMPAWALVWQAFVGGEANPSWVDDGKWLLVAVACVSLALEAWLVAEVAFRLARGRSALPPAPAVDSTAPAGPGC